MKKILFVSVLLAACTLAGARERTNRKIFETAFNAIPDKETVFSTDKSWVPYPSYTDRTGWKNLLGDNAKALINAGEKKLKYEWEVTTAMEYLEFEKDGNRKHTKMRGHNVDALGTLALAELAEGKGRFIPQIINGMFYATEISTWQFCVHTSAQKTKRQLPEKDDQYITLGSASTAAMIAIIWHFFHEEFDKYDPSISRTILNALEKNTFQPYLDSSKDRRGHSWMGFHNGKMGNWTTYCNGYVMQAFLYAQQDPAKILEAVKKGMQIEDRYMDYARMDGACEEGPSYWGMAGAKVYDLAKFMYDVTKGKMNLLTDEQIQRMCIWKSSIDLGGGWCVNYGDGGARGGGDGTMIYRMGIDLKSQELKNYGIYLACDFKNGKFLNTADRTSDLFRALESIRFCNDMKEDMESALAKAGGDWDALEEELRSSVKSAYYPDTQTAVLRDPKGWVIAPKAGYNGEGHNHNDVGNFILVYNGCMALIDQGNGEYGKTTFGPKRYTDPANWHLNSYGHNVPVINGEPQSNGDQFTATNVSCNVENRTFTADIAKAYGENAKVESWVRAISLDNSGATISDTYKLTERKAADDLHFIAWGEPKVTKKGVITLKAMNYAQDKIVPLKMLYSKNLTASVRKVEHTNSKLMKRWGSVYEISLKSSEKAPLSGTYTIKITK